ncbi:MAG: cysteine--tRNA ligase, partial [Syntrophales bacterium]|nr:cysteine--tRNA ligase [Syntrophales bacterium]
RLYNTITKQKEPFQPVEAGKAGIYVCGITAYDVCHVGHARSAVVFDVIVRYLRYRGYQVTYVKNFTDVDDKIIDKANAEGTDIFKISERYIGEHNEDMDALGVIRPDHAPRATEHIERMIELINKLIANNLAYVIGGDVYFAVEKFKDYGQLSGRTLEDMLAGARVDVNEKKFNPLDFALWKASKEGEPWWESPWGRGRPGWHIECSVMSQHFLGDTFDIHGGGEDLIFPHHENEMAQSKGTTGKPLAKYWLHNGFVRINSEKMSKSLGNFFTIRDMLKAYHPEVLRLFILQNHYRSPVDYTDAYLAEVRQGMNRLYAALKTIRDALTDRPAPDATPLGLTGKHAEVLARINAQREKFVEAMDDDFNTARAVGCLFEATRIINGYLAEKPSLASPETLFILHQAHRYFEEAGGVLGFFRDAVDDYFLKDREKESAKQGLNAEEIERLIGERNIARGVKNWEKADEIRKTLAGKNVILKDSPASTTWEIG